MYNLFNVLKKLMPFGQHKATKAQQKKLDEISAKELLAIQAILEKCAGWNNSDYIRQIKRIEKQAEEKRAKVLKGKAL